MATTTNFGWETPDDTDLVKDGALAIRTLGSAIDTSLVDLKGGTTGQVLSKTSNTDMDFTWVAQDDSNAIQNAIVDAKGDLISATAADTPARLAVGTNGQVLTADSTTATGLKWATASGGGLVLIGTTTFTTSSAVNVNDVFSTTYDNYRIVCNVTPTNDGDILFRYRVSGSDNTTSNYNYQGFDIEGTSGTAFRLTGQTAGRFGAAQANVENSFALDMFAPYLSRKKRNNSYSGRGTNASPGITFLSTTFDTTTSFTGFSIFNATGTLTGTISVYGYAK